MSWKDKAIKMLEDSLVPVPSELNGLDWKGGLSNKTDRSAQHICAFANHKGGGLLVFGVNDDATFKSLSKEEIEETVKKLGNIAKNNLSEAITIEHAVLDYNGYALLFVHIPEQTEKPIHLKGKDIYQAYHRSAGHTEKMSRLQVKSMIADSQGRPFEKRIARENVSTEELLTLLNYRKLYELQERKIPVDTTLVAEHLTDCGFCIRSGEVLRLTTSTDSLTYLLIQETKSLPKRCSCWESAKDEAAALTELSRRLKKWDCLRRSSQRARCIHVWLCSHKSC